MLEILNSRSRPHPKDPSLLVICCLLGILFAILQHLLYTWLDGRAVNGPGAPFSQPVAVGLGTALAFAAKVALVLCVSITYDQLMWRCLYSHTIKMRDIDIMTGALGNIKAFAHFRLWSTHPLILLVAILTWLLPIAAIISPSSLGTRSAFDPRQQDLPVPALNFGRETFSRSGMIADTYRYDGTSSALQRIANTVAFGGNMLSIPRPSVNSSYVQDFLGPALVCENGTDDFYNEFEGTRQWLWEYEEYKLSVAFAAWTATKRTARMPSNYDAQYLFDNPAETLVALLNATLENHSQSGDNAFQFSTLDEYHSPPYIYFAQADTATHQNYDYTTRLWQCSLHNASYTVNVTNENAAQTVNVMERSILNPITPIRAATECCHWSPEELPILGYQAILEALGWILSGAVLEFNGSGDLPKYTTKVMETSLALTPELYPLFMTRESANATTDSETIHPLSQSLAFGDAVEQLFWNITVSLMSRDVFRASADDGSGALTNGVTIFEAYIAYHYASRNLTIVYTISAALAVLACLLGEYVMFARGKSFTTSYSTISRAMRGLPIDGLVDPNDRTAHNPLPDRWANAKIRLAQSETDEDGDFHGQAVAVGLGVSTPSSLSTQVELVPLREDMSMGKSIIR